MGNHFLSSNKNNNNNNNNNNEKNNKSLNIIAAFALIATLSFSALLATSNVGMTTNAWAQDITNPAGDLKEPAATTPPPEAGGGTDLNCKDITERNFAIDSNNDPNGFDGDNDGIGCETNARGAVAEPEAAAAQPTPEEEQAAGVVPPTGETGPTTTTNEGIAVGEPNPAAPETAPTTTTEEPTTVLGNAIQIEQVGIEQFTAECLQQIADAGLEIVGDAIVLGGGGNNEEAAAAAAAAPPAASEEPAANNDNTNNSEALDQAAEEVTATVQEQLDPATTEALQNQTEAIADEASAIKTDEINQGRLFLIPGNPPLFHVEGVDQPTVEAAEAVQEAATPETVITSIAEDAIIEEIIADTGAQDEVAAAAGDAVESVVSGEVSAEAAAANFTDTVETIANETAAEVTPEVIDQAASQVDPAAVAEEVTSVVEAVDNNEQAVVEEVVTSDAANVTDEGAIEAPVTADQQQVVEEELTAAAPPTVDNTEQQPAATNETAQSVIEDAIIDEASDTITQDTIATAVVEAPATTTTAEAAPTAEQPATTVYDQLLVAQTALDTVRTLLFGNN